MSFVVIVGVACENSFGKKLWDLGQHHVKSRRKYGTSLQKKRLLVLQGHLMYVVSPLT